jgi:hypothetical protein
MTNRVFGALLCGGLMIFSASVPARAQSAPPVTFACQPTKVKGVASSSGINSNGTTYRNIPETVVHFTQGGRGASCILVRFSAQVIVPANDGVQVRAVLDNKPSALPSEAVYLATPSGVFSGHTFEFVFPNVAPGHHVVRMQFQGMSGGTVSMGGYNTVVQHTP